MPGSACGHGNPASVVLKDSATSRMIRVCVKVEHFHSTFNASGIDSSTQLESMCSQSTHIRLCAFTFCLLVVLLLVKFKSIRRIPNVDMPRCCREPIGTNRHSAFTILPSHNLSRVLGYYLCSRNKYYCSACLQNYIVLHKAHS